ncbi:MAG: YqzL family protein [Clostridiales bacterium]|nr:YqzL family protein [Clostridiales bacterium]
MLAKAMWRIFENTGSISAYMLYKNLLTLQ